MSKGDSSRRRAMAVAWAVAALVYAIGLWLVARSAGGSVVEPLFVLAVMGLLMPLLAWATTRGRAPVDAVVDAAHASRNGWAALAYLLGFAVLVLGFGLTALNNAVPDGRAHEWAVLGLKLATMVLLPVWLLSHGGARRWWSTPGPRTQSHWRTLLIMGLALLAFQAVFGRGLSQLQALAPSITTLMWAIPACFVWQCLEAGLSEEVLFRVFAQQRLADWMGAPLAAVPLAALAFGLAHAPGLYLRGAHLLEGVAEPTVTWAIGYSITVVAPAGVLFGVLWARTRSLPLLVVLHGLTDTLPQLPGFIRTWG